MIHAHSMTLKVTNAVNIYTIVLTNALLSAQQKTLGVIIINNTNVTNTVNFYTFILTNATLSTEYN